MILCVLSNFGVSLKQRKGKKKEMGGVRLSKHCWRIRSSPQGRRNISVIRLMNCLLSTWHYGTLISSTQLEVLLYTLSFSDKMICAIFKIEFSSDANLLALSSMFRKNIYSVKLVDFLQQIRFVRLAKFDSFRKSTKFLVFTFMD